MTAAISGEKVFVTGADGFIGSHLVELLVRSGAKVRALVLYNSWSSLGWLADVPAEIRAEIEIVPGDIRDAERVAAKTAEEFSCSTCFMIVHPRQFGRKDHLTCPEGYDPCPSIKEVEKRLKKAAKK